MSLKSEAVELLKEWPPIMGANQQIPVIAEGYQSLFTDLLMDEWTNADTVELLNVLFNNGDFAKLQNSLLHNCLGLCEWLSNPANNVDIPNVSENPYG